MSNSHHIIPLKYYIGTFISLLILTVITVAVSRVDLGILNTPLALSICFLKAGLVTIYFMGLRWDKGISSILFVGGIGAIILFFLFIFADVTFRGSITEEEKGVFGIKDLTHNTIKKSIH